MKFTSNRSSRYFKETERTVVADDLFRDAARTANSVAFFAKEQLAQSMMLVRSFQYWRRFSFFWCCLLAAVAVVEHRIHAGRVSECLV